MHCRRHVMRGRVVFALCDKELIGNVYREGNAVLDLDRHRGFYIGDDLGLFNGEFESVNAVGRKSTDYIVGKGLAEKGDVRLVCGVPHIQIYKIK